MTYIACSKELRQKVFDPVFRRMIQLLSKQIDLTSTNLEADWKLEKKTDSHLAPFVMRIDVKGRRSNMFYLQN